MESDPRQDTPGPDEKTQSPAQRAWTSFNSQGGFVKILIGSLTAALTAALSALLIALPGAVSGWLDQSADADVSTDSNQSVPQAGAATTTTATVEPATPATVQATTEVELPTAITEPDPVPVEIADVRIRVDDSFFYVDMVMAPSSEPVVVNRVGIAATYEPLPCTGGAGLVELGGVAAVEETIDDVTTFRLEQTEPGVEGAIPVEGASRGCIEPAFTRVAMRPQLLVEPDTPAKFVAKVPREVSFDEAPDTQTQLATLSAYGEPWGEALVVAVGTTAGTCTWYAADLSDVDLPRLDPSPVDPLSLGVCPD